MSDHLPPVPQDRPVHPYAPPQPPAYGMPPMMAVPRTNGVAIAAFVLGLLGISVPAIICGVIGRRQIDAGGGGEQGRWMATTGLILGYVMTALYALVFLVSYIAATSGPGY